VVEQIEESFVLFFNSLPAADAKVSFFEKDPDNLLSSKGIHVRGSGSNQFGSFELLGSLDLSTSNLRCQKTYLPDVRTPRKPKLRSQVRPKGQRLKRKGVITNAEGVDDFNESKDSLGSPDDIDCQTQHYNTRPKKIKSWKQPNWSGSDPDTDFQDTSPTKKKHRQMSAHSSSIATADDVSAYFSVSQVVSSNSLDSVSGSKLHESSKVETMVKKDSSKSKSNKNSTSSSLSKISESKVNTTKGNGAPEGKTHSKSSKQFSSVILPVERDSMDCLWRSAHYYTKGKNKCESNAGDSSTPDTENQCVYEGEFNAGNYNREGFGVCLFSHGNIFEGEWRKDNPHGRGVLMTGDRRHFIYEGEWERGKMHGKGIYYFHSQARSKSESQPTGNLIRRVGVYEGDFKENLRHGYGLYSFPDGSLYEGEWRDNVRSGRGSFQWVDGSSYHGTWKDGKRHGQGVLKASDGFTYEGQWVTNAMDGRGSSVYPNGQRYEGLWSRGKKEGRGTIYFTNGAIYEGRFRDDVIEGQGTMKIQCSVSCNDMSSKDEERDKDGSNWTNWMIPIEFQSDMERIHQKAGFTSNGI